MKIKNKNKKSKGFTLIELLVVIAIIGILSGTIIISISGAQDSAKDSRIKSEMNQLRTVVEIYKASNSGDYTGLASDPEVSLLTGDITTQGGEAPTISSTSDAYCVTSPLASTSSTWCIDSLGFSGMGGCSSYQCDPLLVGTPAP